MALTVVVRSGDLKSQATITFDAPRIVIGRGDGCEIRLPDPSVSHRHASIRQRGTDYVVVDEGSSNGTFVGPVRLSPHAPRVVRSGDLIRVGTDLAGAHHRPSAAHAESKPDHQRDRARAGGKLARRRGRARRTTAIRDRGPGPRQRADARRVRARVQHRPRSERRLWCSRTRTLRVDTWRSRAAARRSWFAIWARRTARRWPTCGSSPSATRLGLRTRC